MKQISADVKRQLNEMYKKFLTIYEVKYSYVDKKYNLGPYVEIIPVLQVEILDYDEIVKAIERLHPDQKEIELMSYSKSKPKFKKLNKNSKVLKNIKFSYIDKKYNMGPYVEFISKLEVPEVSYDAAVDAIEKLHPEYKNVEIMQYEQVK